MAIKAIDLRRGMAVTHKDGLWVCVDNQKVAKGNWRSYQVIQLKNVITGQLIEDRFRTDEGFEQAILEHKPMEYLFTEGKNHVVMDPDSYEQVNIPDELIGDARVYLRRAEVLAMLAAAGLEVVGEATFFKRHQMDDWLGATGCAGEDARRVRELLAHVSEPDGDGWTDAKIVLKAAKTAAAGPAAAAAARQMLRRTPST